MVRVAIPIVNVGREDQWLYPRMVLGTLHVADSPALPDIDFDQAAVAQAIEAGCTVSSDLPELQWPNLAPSEQLEAKALLQKYCEVFSQYEGDLGCT